MQENKTEEKKKKGYIREIGNIKALMDKRKQQRSMALFYLCNAKNQNALIICRQLIFTTQKIWKEFSDDFIEQFQENYFFRTSKAKEHTEYLLDCVLISKAYIKTKKKDDVKEIIDKIECPVVRIYEREELKDKHTIQRYNQAKEVQARFISVIKSFMEIAKAEKFYDQMQKLMEIFTSFTKTNYGPVEYAMTQFQFGNYCYEIKEYTKALFHYEICLNIRKQNTFNDGFVDVLINQTICLREIGQLKQATKQLLYAIQISQDLGQSQENNLDNYYLLLAKIQMENGEFRDCYKNFLRTYKMREHASEDNPKKIQIEINLLFMYRTLQRTVEEKPEENFNITDKKEIELKRKQAQQIITEFEDNILNREDFSKYNQFHKRLAHLTLIITEHFFDELNSEQVQELNNLLTKLNSCSFQKGINQLAKSSFYNEKKTRDQLISSNPILKTFMKKKK